MSIVISKNKNNYNNRDNRQLEYYLFMYLWTSKVLAGDGLRLGITYRRTPLGTITKKKKVNII